MRKDLLLLGICFALTATSVYAGEDCTVINPPSTVKSTVMAPGPVMNPPCAQKQQPSCPCNCGCSSQNSFFAQKYKRFIKRVEHNRATVYNALNLTEEQIKMREEILKENTPIYEKKFESFIKESRKLKCMKSSDAPCKDIKKQKKVVMSIKKDIDKTLEQENKAFRKCLTAEQRAKYDTIKKLEKRDFKHDLNKKDFHKSNPKMDEFGKPCPKKACPVEQQN